MEYLLQLFQQNRQNIISLLQEVGLEKANTIPPGFNNNIIWNAGHTLLAQQLLMYHFSKIPLLIPAEELMPKYGSGTVPDGKATQEDLDQLVSLLKSTSDKAVEDYNNGVFKTYGGYTSEYYKVTMNTIEEAIRFNTYHEGFHLGFMTALKTALE